MDLNGDQVCTFFILQKYFSKLPLCFLMKSVTIN